MHTRIGLQFGSSPPPRNGTATDRLVRAISCESACDDHSSKKPTLEGDNGVWGVLSATQAKTKRPGLPTTVVRFSKGCQAGGFVDVRTVCHSLPSSVTPQTCSAPLTSPQPIEPNTPGFPAC